MNFGLELTTMDQYLFSNSSKYTTLGQDNNRGN